MADRFWRGLATDLWDATAGTKWAATVGGAGGAAVPTAADDVFFDGTSLTCTISGSRVAKSIDCTGYTATLAGTATPALAISGSLTLVAGMTLTYAGTTTFNGTGTLTSAGKTLGSVTINGSGITVTLGDALTITATLTITQGTFTTSASNYSIAAVTLASSNSNTRTISLNGSTITLSGTVPINISTQTNLTFNAGTSSIICTSSVSFCDIAVQTGLTFYNLSFTGTGAIASVITGANIFNDLTVTGPASAGVRSISFDSRTTINGTLSTTGTAGNRRVWFRGATYGLAQTLTINSAPNLTDADFRDVYVIGTAAPISGTRVGDLRGCRGITFSTPKTVYWNLAGAQNWSANGWSDTSTGAPNTNFFPLAQDTATFTNAGSVTGTITMDTALPYTGTVDMSGRTNAMTLSVGAFTIYGDWKNGSGTTLSGSGALTYSGRNTQTITSAGKTLTNPFTIDSYGGSVELADALNISGATLTVTNGTFDTKNFNVTAGSLSSSNSNVRTITLGSSTVTFSSAITFTNNTNLTFNAGTSQITFTGTTVNLDTGASGVTFYNVSCTAANTNTARNITNGTNTFNNLTISAPAGAGFVSLVLSANQTITGTLTVAGATAVRRIFVRSNTLGITITLSVGTLSATDCDFRDIAITGAAAGSSPTRAGDCGGNSGITFPAAKTVYWNLAGAQNWSATAWAPGSGGTPDINNFPLAQDTAVFDEAAGSVTGTITIDQAWNIGTFDASLRTTAMTLTNGVSCFIHGDWKFGTGVTSSSTATTFTFSKRGTQTITSNGITFGCPVAVNSITGTTQLADALSLGATRTLTLTSGTFDAVTYNVTAGLFSATDGTFAKILKLGSGTWTLSGTSTVWDCSGLLLTFYKNTANIVLSNTTTSARAFAGGGLSYNKLTIGGTTGISTLTITGDNQFTELASTKTVAHTIALGTTTQTFGKWTVTGSAGNVVTLTGTGVGHIIAGTCTGTPGANTVDYLAMGSIGFAATSPGEFYAGVNSTGTAGAPVYRTARPFDSTRYWIGGTGNWSDTARWSTSSGGPSGAVLPRSHDNVVFDNLSNATAYTATVNAVTGGIRMKSLTIAGPAAGNLTLTGSELTFVHDNISFPASGFVCSYSGTMTLTGSTTGRTLTTNGITHSFSLAVNGVNCGWAFGSAATPGGIIVTNGSLDFAGYNVTTVILTANNANTCTVNFGSGTTTISGTNCINFGTTENTRANLTITASTSQINCSIASPTFSGNNQTFYNVAFTSTSAGTVTINGTNSFNNLSFTGITTADLKVISLTANQTVTGTLTFSAGTDATMRHFCRSNGIGLTRTITAAAVSMTDVDFRDITIAGAAAPASGTRIGDCNGNSGITFTAAANKYWNLAAGGNWGGAIGWATGSGGTPAINNFPLAQDTCFFEATGLNSGATVTVNAAYNIGTIDMSARTANTMTLATGTTTPAIYGNWINGTGTTLSGTATMTFAGRGSQTITSAGRTFTQQFNISVPGASVSLADALTINNSSSGISLNSGTLDAVIYNVTFSNGGTMQASSGSATRVVAIGSGTWTTNSASAAAWNTGGTNVTITGTGTISLTGSSFKTFTGGGKDYSGITLNQGGQGTLTITGNNTFKDITNTYKTTGATTIDMGTTTQRVSQWTAAGEAARLLTIQGNSASSPCTLIHTGTGTAANVNYLVITGVRAY